MFSVPLQVIIESNAFFFIFTFRLCPGKNLESVLVPPSWPQLTGERKKIKHKPYCFKKSIKKKLNVSYLGGTIINDGNLERGSIVH